VIWPEDLVGVPGIEPGNGGIKIRCLTAWLYPNKINIIFQCKLGFGMVIGAYSQKKVNENPLQLFRLRHNAGSRCFRIGF
jgi:hypothetical protein